MPVTYLKKAIRSAETGQTDVRAAVEAMLAELAREGDAAAIRYTRDLDKWDGDIIVSDAARIAAQRGYRIG